MAQTSKFIDVTRSFAVLDPNSFPQSMHIGRGDSTPEDPIPSVAYAGYNFMPTATGYKSYFGTEQRVAIDALTQKIDMVFLYQSVTLDNALIALCDTGIWYKAGASAGAWTQLKATYLAGEADGVYHRWTVCSLENNLYCFQEGGTLVYRLYSDATNVLLKEEIAPTFLNMAGQIGIFRAGNRLGFWDSENSIAWSNIDDFGDFVPSVETLAGITKFSDIKGTIVSIESHGEGFIVYSTKSIVWIRNSPDELYQWNPSVVFTNNGIAYPRQVAIGVPDSLHFAYTSSGIYKISDGKEELIIPEIFDYLNESNTPIYLQILQGRYLFVETMDPNLVIGKVVYETGYVEDSDLVFPSVDVDIADAVVDSGSGSLCPLISSYGEFTDQRYTGSTPGDKKPNTDYQPVYKAYLRPPSFISGPTWTSAACPVIFNGETIPMQPVEGGVADFNTLYREVLGEEAYIDGRWTIERFVQAQTAIWDMDAEALETFRNAIEAKYETRNYYSGCSLTDPADVPHVRTRCNTGKLIPSGFAPIYEFNFSKCSFSLTRYALGQDRVVTTQVTNSTGELNLSPTPTPFYLIPINSLSAKTGATPEECAEAWRVYEDSYYTGAVNTVSITPDADNVFYSHVGGQGHKAYKYTYFVAFYGFNLDVTMYKVATVTPGYSFYTVDPQSFQQFPTGCLYRLNNHFAGSNTLEPYAVGLLADTAYCTQIGWKYEKNDGSFGFIASSTCAAPNILPTPPKTSSRPKSLAPSKKDGSLCGKAFEPISLPASGGIPAIDVSWPEEVITYPGTSFLLRDGTSAPYYPTMEGAYVYDLHLKKWGKFKGSYKRLLDYSPLNASPDGIIATSNFGILGGIADTAGSIRIFDKYPLDARITYGKIGYNRSGLTSLEECKVDFREAAVGYVITEGSLDGRHIAPEVTNSKLINSEQSAVVYGTYPAKWHQITIAGIFDIAYIEYKAFNAGRR